MITGIKKILNYKIIEQVSKNSLAEIYLAIDENNRSNQVYIHALKQELVSRRISDFIRYRKELGQLMSVSGVYTEKNLELLEYKERYYLITEYYEGRSLEYFFAQGHIFSEEEILEIITKTAEALGKLHEAGILHRGLNPENIILTNEGGVKIGGIGLRQILDLTGITHGEGMKTIFSYMAPEQSGLFHRNVDERSDLYSLGIIYYRLLTHRLPFTDKIFSSLIHKHIAGIPPLPSSIDPGISRIPEEMVMKLIEKDPAKRYQSAAGFMADIRRYRDGDTGFRLGREDEASLLSYKTSLVGRQEEYNQLKAGLQKAKSGEGQFFLLKGAAGSGKSRLAEELFDYAVAGDIPVLSARCFSGVNKTPYGPLRDAFTLYLDYFRSREEEERKRITVRLKSAMEGLEKIICDLLPAMKEILGEGAEPLPLEGEKASLRFFSVIAGFITQISTLEKGLVLFLDDLQWVDAGTLEVLYYLSLNLNDIPLFLAGAFRSDEPAESLGACVDRIAATGFRIKEIEIRPFEDPEMKLFVSGLLNHETGSLNSLSGYLLKTTRGNPFFTIQMLKELVDKGILVYRSHTWQTELVYPENETVSRLVVETIMRRTGELKKTEMDILTCGALAGSEFDMELLFGICVAQQEEIVEAVDRIIRLQFIEYNGRGRLVFVHNRIKEAFLENISPERKQELHRKIGELLENGATGPDALYSLAYHFTEAGVGDRILKYCRLAGLEAKKNWAHHEAIQYLERAYEYLMPDNPDEQWLEINGCLAETYLFTGDYIRAVAIYDNHILPYLKSPEEKALVYLQVTTAYYKMADYKRCESYAEKGFRLLKEQLPVGKVGVTAGILKELLVHMCHVLLPFLFVRRNPAKRKSRYELIIRFYFVLNWIYTMTDRRKLVRTVLRMLNLSEKGLGPSSELARAYGQYGGLCMNIPLFKRAVKYFNRALEMEEISPDTRGQVLQLAGYCYQWKGEYDTSSDYFRRSSADYKKIGDTKELLLSEQGIILNLLYKSRLKEAAAAIRLHKKISQPIPNAYLRIEVLYDLTHLYIFRGSLDFSLDLALRAYNMSLEHHLDFNQCFCCTLVGKIYLEKRLPHKALFYLEKARKLDEENGFMQQFVVEYNTLIAETYMRIYQAMKPEERRPLYVKKIGKLCRIALRRCRPWATLYGDALRVSAGYFALRGRYKKAEKLFQKSLDHEKRIRRLYSMGVACYEYGSFLIARDRNHDGRMLVEQGLSIFTELNSRVFRKRCSELLGLNEERRTSPSMISLMDRQRFESILKVCQDIASVVDLGELLEKILTKSLEITGAQNGYLFIYNSDINKLELKFKKDDSEPDIPGSVNFLVQQVFMNEQEYLNDDPEEPDGFIYDSRSQSVICVPLKSKNSVLGVCYLDNRLAPGVFSREDMEVLRVIMIQAAISIENADVIQKLQRVNNIKDEFLANTSHELRTPLHGIIGIAQGLYDGSCGETTTAQQENLRMIIQSGKRLSILIDDILDFSKLKNNDLPLSLQPLDIKGLADHVIKLLTPLAGEKSLKIVNRIPDNIPLVMGDENRILQILYNLIGNSVKFTPEGSVMVSASEKKGMLEICVQDTGIGIPSDKLQNIFSEFTRVEDSLSKGYSGTGLGLSITKKLVNIHGGTIRAESQRPGGSSFYFTLPVTGDRMSKSKNDESRLSSSLMIPETADQKVVIPEKRGEEKKSIRILVVDDEAINRQVLCNHLARDYEVTTASRGREALDLVFNDKTRPDILLLDLMMPVLSGFDVCKEIRKMYPKHILPVIMVTARNRIPDMVMGFKYGVNDYLPKPFNKEELLVKVKLQEDIIHLRKNEMEVQKQLYQADRLITLGTSVSEITHEINNFNYVIYHNALLLKRRFQYLAPVLEEYYENFGDFPIGAQPYSQVKNDLPDTYDRILNNSDNISNLIKSIKDFCRKESLEKVEFSMSGVITEAVSMCSIRARKKSIRILCHDCGNLPPFFGNRQLLIQLLINLINNSIDATDEKGAEIVIGSGFSENFLYMSVTDSGVGIASEDLENIRKPFFTTKSEKGGLGLGLTLVTKILECHNGRMEIDSVPGKGTKVNVILPNNF